MQDYHRPRHLDDALALLAAAPGLQLLAGGTDIYPAEAGAAAWMRQQPRSVLDISALPGLDGIGDAGDHHHIGALVTWGALRDAVLPPWFAGLQAAAAQVGGRQVQHRGTLLGNLCNASPAADGVPALLALDAQVELASLRGRRLLPLQQFVLGNRRTALAADEMAVGLRVPKPAGAALAGFEKLGARRYLVISIAMAAAVIEAEAGLVRCARIAIGACSAVAMRLPGLEAALAGQPLAAMAGLVQPGHLAGLSPIDDIRASAAYRRQAALVLLRRLLARLGGAQAVAA